MRDLPVIQRIRVARHVAGLAGQADARTTAGLIALTLCGSTVAAATALSQRWLVDQTRSDQLFGVLAAVALGAAALTLAEIGTRVRFCLHMYLVERVSLSLDREILGLLDTMPTVVHLEDAGYLDRLHRLRRGTWALADAFWSALGVLTSLLGLLASVLLLVGVDPALAALAVSALAPLLATRRSSRIVANVQERVAEWVRREERLHALCIDSEAGMELRILGTGAVLSAEADRLWRRVARAEAVGRMRAGAWELTGWLCYASAAFVALLIVGREIASGRASAGDAALVVSLAFQMQSQVRQVVNAVGQAAEAGHVGRDYLWIRRQAEPRSRGGSAPVGPIRRAIELSEVNFRYPGASQDALCGVNLRLPAGSTVALVGPNGAGKSTLVRLLTGLARPTAGTFTVDDRPFAEIPPASWQASTSAVFQDFARFQFTLAEAVGVGDVRRLHARGAVADALRRANGAAAPDFFGGDLSAQLGAEFGGTEPSVGQWQKIAIARALMRCSSVLVVLDEPSAALDAHIEHDLFETVMTEARSLAADHGTIVVLVSHRFSTVRMADLIVHIDGGRIVEQGSHAELIRAGGGYASMYKLQTAAYR